MIKSKKIYYHMLCISLCSISGCGDKQEAPCEIVITKKSSRYYKVKSGDTVTSIASANGISEDELIQLNKLSPPYSLFVGQRLKINQKSQIKSCDIVDKDVSVRPIEEKVINDPKDNKLASLYSGQVPEGMILNSDGTLVPKDQPQNVANINHSFKDLDNVSDISNSNPSRPLVINDNPATVANSEVVTPPQVATVATTDVKFYWPVKGDIIQKFDAVKNKGINISAPKGTPVKAISDGVAKYVGSQVDGYGKMVMIKHGDGKISTYAHLQTVTIKENAIIKGGQKIGTVGNTGLDSGKQPQLHLQIRGKNKQPLDPMIVLSN